MNLRTIHFFAFLLRKTRLLSLANYLLFIKSVINSRKPNKDFIAEHKDFTVPPASLAFDAYGDLSNKAYFDSGVAQAKIITGIINEHVKGDDIKVYEWGCGPARILRHIKPYLQSKSAGIYGTDYNRKSIEWCQGNLKGMTFALNELGPPLKFESDLFDCVYAISVFTHLSEAMHFAWIKELQRVVKPGGIMIITTHGALACQERLLPHEEKLYKAGKLVVRGDIEEGKKWFLTYHPDSFIRETLLEGCDVLSHTRFGNSVQDVWVVRNRKG